MSKAVEVLNVELLCSDKIANLKSQINIYVLRELIEIRAVNLEIFKIKANQLHVELSVELKHRRASH